MTAEKIVVTIKYIYFVKKAGETQSCRPKLLISTGEDNKETKLCK